MTLSIGDLTHEFDTLVSAAAEGAPVVPVVPYSLTSVLDDEGVRRGGGFLLRDVCTRAVVDSLAQCKAAFTALRALHSKRFAHGDARLPNLLARGRAAELVWIDLRHSSADALESAQRADGRTLAASVLGTTRALPAPVDAALNGVPDGGDAAYVALAAAVWAARGAV